MPLFQDSGLTRQPDFHPQKPIIVGSDDRLESPETLTLRYEEAQAGHGVPEGDYSPRLYEMAAYGKAAPLPSMNGKCQESCYDGSGSDKNLQATIRSDTLNQHTINMRRHHTPHNRSRSTPR